ncbi:hypothetical protein C10C_0642 [Chlamydia serpentis]|uniref:Uncharacterized protein n=1 Tax=Chlamydia serpentis TaxID=1967782 RepID=A0A2R8FBV5_9CHLA|nr:hypothetical protein [Chlamydia serpentis]SPN73796.1 hypothetical protein C10C_0642 [Chlamydia serpentis]
MAINPSGQKPDDMWVGGTQDQNTNTQQTEANLGTHRLSTSTTQYGPLTRAQQLWKTVRDFFGIGKGSSSTASSLKATELPGRPRPSRPAPPPPTTGGTRPGSPTHGKGPAPQPPQTSGARPKRAAPPPPTTGGTRPGSPTHGKGPAPQPPQTSGARPKRAAPPPPTTGPKPIKGILKQPGSFGSGQRVHWADQQKPSSNLDQLEAGLKEIATNQSEAKQQLNNISRELQSKWSAWEESSNTSYLLHGYRVVQGQLKQVSEEQANLITGTSRSGAVPSAVIMAKEVGNKVVREGLKNQLNPVPGTESDGLLLQVVTVLALEGPTLDSSESITNFLRTRVQDFDMDGDSEVNIENEISALGNALDRVRRNYSQEMPRVWLSLTQDVMAAVNSQSNAVRAENAGQTRTRDVVRMSNESGALLNTMRGLSTSTWANTMTVLVSDLFD